MRLTRLEIENFKRISALRIDPKGNVIELSGPNGAGKSSTLDAIWVLLRGLSVAPVVPIRTGAERCVISGKLGDLNVTRIFRRKDGGGFTSEIKIENPDGSRYPSPQKKLDEIVGEHMLDPHDFLEMDERKRLDVLRNFVGNFDFDAIERQNKTDFDLRTAVNRQAKEARIAASQIPVPEGTPSEPVDETLILDELQRASDHNADIEQRRQNRARMADQVLGHQNHAAQLRTEAQELLRRAEKLQQEAVTEDQAAAELQAQLASADPLPEPIDPSVVRERLNHARATNVCVQQLKRRQGIEANAARLEGQAAELTAAIDKRNAEKEAAIAAARMPVAGIAFGDGVVLLNGLPFSQASQAEKLRTAFAVALAQHPKLPLVWIRDASLLDDESMRIVSQLAEEHDCQVWLETVRATGKEAIVLEDGHVKRREATEDAA